MNNHLHRDFPTRPVMMDVEGLTLDSEDRELLLHPLVGAVILFGRNCQSPDQIIHLCNEIRSVNPELLISVDQEGGRVQRIKAPLTEFPPLGVLGQWFQKDSDFALHASQTWGWLLASEVLSLGIDFSFAPVLDIEIGRSKVIGDRAFHSDPETVTVLAEAFVRGMQQAGMAATGKHFPGHGYVVADSHVAIPVDERPFETIEQQDLKPFEALIAAGINAIMPAHVIYEKVDPNPAGFSRYWLQTVLREQLGFDGIIFSDDLSMAGAGVAGDIVARAQAAWQVGCDMVVVCNDRAAVKQLLSQWQPSQRPANDLHRMKGQASTVWQSFQNCEERQRALADLAPILQR